LRPVPALAFVPMPNTRDSYSEEIIPDAATDGINRFNDKIIAEFRANGDRVSGSLAGPHPPHRRQVRDRARHAPGLTCARALLQRVRPRICRDLGRRAPGTRYSDHINAMPQYGALGGSRTRPG
jgi:hypothetical protein